MNNIKEAQVELEIKKCPKCRKDIGFLIAISAALIGFCLGSIFV